MDGVGVVFGHVLIWSLLWSAGWLGIAHGIVTSRMARGMRN
jgi:hypothetical protein